MKNILMIGMTPNPGGIESFIMTFYRYLKKYNKNKFYQSTYHYFNYVPETKILSNMFDKT